MKNKYTALYSMPMIWQDFECDHSHFSFSFYCCHFQGRVDQHKQNHGTTHYSWNSPRLCVSTNINQIHLHWLPEKDPSFPPKGGIYPWISINPFFSQFSAILLSFWSKSASKFKYFILFYFNPTSPKFQGVFFFNAIHPPLKFQNQN